MKSNIGLLIGTGVLAVNLLSAQPSITILSPSDTDRWSIGFTYPIRWTVTGVDSIRIEYSTTGAGGPWYLITSGIPSSNQGSIPLSDTDDQEEFDRFTKTGSYYWTLQYNFSDSCYIRISDKSDLSIFAFRRYINRYYSNWTEQVSETDLRLYAVHTSNYLFNFFQVGWAGGESGLILRTVDSGIHWVASGMLEGDVHTITAFETDLAIAGSIAASGAAKINRTTNGGISWNVVDSTATVWRRIQMFNATTGYAFGDPVGGFWVLKRTTNGGSTWSDFPIRPSSGTGEQGIYNAVAWIDENLGWFGTSNGTIYRTTDGGTSWMSAVLQPGSSSITALYFNSGSFGLIGCADGSIYRSTNGAVSWAASPTVLPSAVIGISGLTNSSECWAASGQNIYRTYDGGQTWFLDQFFGYAGSEQLNHMSLAGPSNYGHGWAVGNNGMIVRFFRPITEVPANSPEIPSKFVLYQNYPNPFNPGTRIGFRIQETGFVSLKVFDVLGREVVTLVNEEMTAGGHERAFDGRDLSSGIYFYRLQASGFVQTRKLLLLK